MDLKKTLKYIKLHEQQITIVMSVIIIFLAGVLIFRYLKNITSEAPSPNNSTQKQVEKYTVVKGDTLWSISEKYYQKGDNWKEIADANNITDAKKLEVGQELVIPEVKNEVNTTPTPAPPTPQITENAASTTNEITGDSYTVVHGDCLWTIAVRAYGDGEKWHQIAEVNHLANPRIIHSGNIFILPR